MFWRLNTKKTQRFVEIDLPEICQLKAQKLKLTKREWGYGDSEHENYELRAGDLEEDFLPALEMSPALPTLVLSDVVLSYLESDATV